MARTACMSCPGVALPGRSRCAACGGDYRRDVRTSAQQQMRREVNRTGGARCSLCGHYFPARDVEIDHALPLRDGGRDARANVQPLCHGCHATKTAAENADRAHQSHTH